MNLQMETFLYVTCRECIDWLVNQRHSLTRVNFIKDLIDLKYIPVYFNEVAIYI